MLWRYGPVSSLFFATAKTHKFNTIEGTNVDNLNAMLMIHKKNLRDVVFEDLSNYHQNIKITVEVNPSKFLDRKLIREKGAILSQVFNKPISSMNTGVSKLNNWM